MRKNRKSKKGLVAAIILLLVVILGLGAFAVKDYSKDNYMTLKGEEHMTIGLNGVYEEPGVEAIRGGKDASSEVKISGEVDSTTPGDYEIEYQCGNFKRTRTVTVDNKMNPELKLKGDNVIKTKLGEKIKDPGCTATAEDGTDLTDAVKVSDFDATTAGDHLIEYTVSDDKGNTTRITRKLTIEPNTHYDNKGIVICMYHYVYNEDDPPADLEDRWGNYIGADALTEEIEWLKSENYYFPTWEEVRAYVDGEKLLPDKSIVLTFDDGEKNFLRCGIPVLEKCQVPATSFVITKNKGEQKVKEYQSEYVDYESHSHNMHRTGGNIGHGGIFTVIPYEEGMADLKKSIDIVGNNKAFAYPYGDYNDSSVKMVKDSGFMCAVTTQPGRVHPGDNPLLLNRQRMVLRQSLETFKAMVRP